MAGAALAQGTVHFPGSHVGAVGLFDKDSSSAGTSGGPGLNVNDTGNEHDFLAPKHSQNFTIFTNRNIVNNCT